MSSIEIHLNGFVESKNMQSSSSYAALESNQLKFKTLHLMNVFSIHEKMFST